MNNTQKTSYEEYILPKLVKNLKLRETIEELKKQRKNHPKQRPDLILDDYAIEITRANYGETQDASWGRFHVEYLDALKRQPWNSKEKYTKIMRGRSGLEAERQNTKDDGANLKNSILLLFEIKCKNAQLMQLDPIGRYNFYKFSIQFIQEKNKKDPGIFNDIIALLNDVIKRYNNYCQEYSDISEKIVESFIIEKIQKKFDDISIDNIPIYTITDKQCYIIIDKIIEKNLQDIHEKLKNKCNDIPNPVYGDEHEDNIHQMIRDEIKKKIEKYNNNRPKHEKKPLGNTILFIDVLDWYSCYFNKYEENYQADLLEILHSDPSFKSKYFDRIILSGCNNDKPCYTL
jgi:hypothetical protein